VDLQLSTNQTRQQKQEDFINLDNSKAKICRTKTNFSSSPSASSCFSSPLALSTAGKLLESRAVDFQLSTIRDGSKKTRGFHSSRQLQGQTKPAKTKQAPKKNRKKREKKGSKKPESKTSNALQPEKQK
jgi:hypothetical protein